MSVLPTIPYPRRRKLEYQVDFKGLNHVIGAQDGDIYDMKNMTSDHYPVMSPRERRRTIAKVTNGKGLFPYAGKLYWIDGRDIFRDGEVIGQVEDREDIRYFVALGHRILIFPDALYIDADGTVGALGASVTSEVTFIADGFYNGSPADCNSIYARGADWGNTFRVGDAVKISGCKKYDANNKTSIIREIDGDTLRFYENAFALDYRGVYTVSRDLAAGEYCFADAETWYHMTLPAMTAEDTLEWKDSILTATVGGAARIIPTTEGKSGTVLVFGQDYLDTKESSVTLSRDIPDMDVVCAIGNRLWGAKGNEIYGSKLGDPFNFNVFDGLTTDSYFLETETDGDITACIGYNGYPMFFKEDSILKLYGNYPSNFQLSRLMQQGVKKGCGRSLAIAGEILYYISKSGVMAYSGGRPTMISEPLGKRLVKGVGSSEGQKYYLSADCEDGSSSLYVFDSRKNMWHREDETKLVAAGYGDYVAGMTEKEILALSHGCEEGTIEDSVDWMVEFADITIGSPYKKGINKFNIRIDPSGGGVAKVEIMYDSNGRWDHVKTIDHVRKHSDILPITLHRCDHFKVRVRGTGIVDIYSFAIQYYSGSEEQGGGYYINGH